MSSLGSLYYTLGLKDLTDADFQRINAKLEKSGCTIKLTPELLKPVTDIIPKWVSIDINPNQVEQAKLDNAINGKVMHAEVLPLAGKLKSAVVDALKSQQVPLEGITIPPDKIAAAVTNALSSANFTAVGDKAGDEIAKAIKVKVEGEKYNVTLTPDVSKLTKIVNDALDKIFAKEQKIKLDRSDIKAFRDELKNKVGEAIKITPTINLTQEAINKAVEGKVMRIEVLPLIDKLRKAIKDATTQSPAEIEVGVQETKLRNLINNILGKQGFMISIKTVDDNYTKVVQQKLNGRIYTVKIHADAREISRSVQTSLMNIQSRSFGLQVSKDILRQSIETALMGKPFNIQIAVMHDQARRAVQNALNNARMVGKDDALAFQRLQTGELRAAQAELARLKAAHQSAASAANTHASASINLGGALGSNIKIAGELGAAIASLYSVHAAKQFLSQVIEIGGELEHQKIALETIYGTPSKMESLYGQIKSLARQSPFGVMELTKNVKQLSAYGVAYNEVYDTAKRLADISAATSVDIQRLILAFGKTKNRTFLDGLEAKQFAYANIPIYDALSKKLTELEGKFVSVKDVMGRIKKREIGFDMVKDILWDMTDEGGKFYNMQEKLAGSVKTSWKLVRDNIELMFGEIAESGVGDALKSIGQTMQELTRNWRALSTIIATGGGAFAIYKLAVMGTNALLDKQVGSITANYLAEKQAQATKLQSIGLTSTLSARERELIATRKRLTATDLEYLFVEKGLDNEGIKRLYLSGKITRAELQRAVALGVLTQAEFEAIAGTNAWNGALLRLDATAKGTWATIKTGAASAFSMIFNWTTAAFAAIAGVAYLIQHNVREDKIAEDFTKTWKQKGEDMAKELSASLSKPFENLSAPQATELIEEYKNLIKDFATLPDDAIQRAIYDKDGNIRNTADQIKYLREELEALKKTAESMSQDMGTIVGATGDGWFKEDVITNLKDYSDAYNKANSIYLKFVNDHKDTAQKMVEAARSQDAAFAEEIAYAQNLTEQFTILMRERANFPEAWKAAQDAEGFWATRGGNIFKSLGGTIVGKTTPFEASLTEIRKYKQAMKDLQSTIQGIKNTYEGWDWNNLSESQAEAIRQAYRQVVETAEFSAPELKRTVADAFQDAFNIKIIPDKTEDNWMDNAKKVVANVSDEATKEALRVIKIEGTDKLNDAQKELVKKLFTTADEETQKQLPKLFANAQSWINQNPLFARINLFFDKTQGKLSQAAQDIISSKGGTDKLSAITTDLLKEVDGEGKSVYDIRNALQEKRQQAKNKMEAAIKGGLSETTQSFKDAKQEFDNVETALKELDWTDLITKDQKSNKGSKETKKDAFAESLKQRFKDIKDAWNEFQKWSKSEGKEAAANRIGESGLFSTLSADQIPKTIEDYRALVTGLEDELRKAGVKGNARESLLNDLLKQLLDIDKTVVDEQLKLALDKVSKEAERQIADWNLFDKIRKATGNQDLAMSIAFGLNDDAKTDYPTLVKNQFNEVAKATKSTLTFDTATPELLKEAPDEVQKAWEKAYSDIQKYRDKEREDVADMVAQYRNTQEEIVALTAEAEEKKRKIRENKDLSPVQKQQITDRIDADLNYQIFQKSGEYLKFFNAILSMTGKEAEDVGKKIKEALDQKLQAGTISAKDYCEEMEKIDKQLEIIRTKQKGFGGFGSFAKGGLQQMFQDRFEQAQSDYNKAVQDFDTAKQQFDIFSKEGNEAGMKQAQSAMDSASAMQEGASAAMEGAQGAMQTVAVIDTVVHGINDTVQGIRDAFYSIQDMADSFGVDTSADTDWGAAGAFLDAFSQASEGATKAWDSLKSGNIGGVISGVVQSVTSWFTVFNQWHDAKLQKQIERSQEIVDNIQRAYDKIERRMANFLGNGKGVDIFNSKQMQSELKRVNAEIAKFEKIRRDSKSQGIGTKKVDKELEALYKERESYKERIDAYDEGGAYALQRQMMKEQLAEMEEQKADMEAMKKKDPEAIADLEDQIDEMKVKIQDFAEEVAKDLYGIDLKGWASQIGDAIVDAFAAGEDAAEAFDKTVADIMRSVVKSMISVGVIQPAMEDLRDYLFGDNGVFSKGINGGDFELSKEDAVGLSNKLSGLKGSVEDAKAIYDYINDLTGGMLDDAEKSKSGMTAGLQSLTEDTGDLLVSYVNGMRGDLSVIRADWEVILSEVPQMNIIAEAQLTAQRQIAENTLRNAIAAEALLVMAGNLAKSNDDIHRLLNRATQGGVKFYIH